MEKDIEFYNTIIEKVKECGEILKSADLDKSPAEKKDGSLVTKYDLLIDKKLTTELKKIYNIPVFSEEHEENFSNTYFVIDPIDGTHNFNSGLDYFGIMVAYVENNETLFSVIHLPVLNKTYTAYKGKGAYLNGEKICVRKSTNRLLGVTNVGQDRALENIKKLIHNSNYKFEFRSFYCACVPMPYIASGNLDFNIYVGPCGLWDIIVPGLILQEAGGYLEYKEYEPNKFEIISGTKESYDIIKSILK